MSECIFEISAHRVLSITVSQDEDEMFPVGRPKIHVFPDDAIPREIICCNPRCGSTGGVNLWGFMENARGIGETTFQCSGYETTAMRCENVFTVRIESTRERRQHTE